MDNRQFFTRERLALLAILFVSVLIYLPAMHGLMILDDRMIATGAAIGGGKSFLACFTKPFLFAYFRPLVSASFWLEIHLWGANPFLLHQTNILIHLLTTFLVVRLAMAFGLSERAALLSGLFFAVQPAQIGAVAWIGGRTDAQACFFFVLMMLAIAGFYRSESARTRAWWIPVGVLSALAAMLTKEQVLPAMIIAPLAGLAFRAPRRQIIIGSAPYLAAGLVFFALWFLNSPEHMKGATVPLGEIASQISRTTLNYTLLFVAPNPWSMHTFSLETLRSPALIALGAALTILIPFGIWRLWRYDARLGVLALVGGLVYLPVSNLIPIPSLLAAPYRVAISGPSVAILFGFAAVHFAGRFARYRSERATAPRTGMARLVAIPAAAGAVALAGFVLTPWGASLHKDEVTLFGACSHFDHKSFYMRGNYINALIGVDRNEEALAQADVLLDQVFAGQNWRDFDRVDAVYRADPRIAARILANHGARAEADGMVSRYFVIQGQLLMKQHNDRRAQSALAAATRLDPKDDAAYYALGDLLLPTDATAAVRDLRRCIAINPANSNAIYTLGHYFVTIRDYQNAYRTLERFTTVQNDTGMPLLELADAELRLGRVAEARTALQLASTKIVEPHRLGDLMTRAWARS